MILSLDDDDFDPPLAKPMPGLKSRVGQPQIARWGMKELQKTKFISDDESEASPDNHDDIAHVTDCRDAKCPRCLFLRNRETWEEAASLHVSGTRTGTWLVPCMRRGRWGLGCWVCRKSQQESEWSSGVIQTNSLGNIRRHGKKQSAASECTAGMWLRWGRSPYSPQPCAASERSSLTAVQGSLCKTRFLVWVVAGRPRRCNSASQKLPGRMIGAS